MKDNKLFRKKTLERFTSPEQLNDYIKVSNPGVWMVLVAIIVILIGVFVWGIYGRLDTKLTVATQITDGNAVCYVKKADIASVKVGQTIQIGSNRYTVDSVSAVPTAVTDEFGEYALHVGTLSTGEWVYEVSFNAQMADGTYAAEIVIDSVAPISFVLN